MSRRPGGKTGWLGPAAGRAWRVLAGLGLMIVLAVSAPSAWSAELDLNKAFLFLDSAKPGTADGIEAPKKILPWTSPEKERVIAVLTTIAAKAPNFIANVTRFGPVHLYRAKPAGKTRANAHASYRALIFNKLPQNTQHLKDSIVHELVHVSDPYGRIANSAA